MEALPPQLLSMEVLPPCPLLEQTNMPRCPDTSMGGDEVMEAGASSYAFSSLLA